ncbi:GAF domain-containing protein, partial [Ketobacter sp.]
MSNTFTSPVIAASNPLVDTYIALSKSELIWKANLNSALSHIARTCAGVMDVERVSVWQLNSSQTELVCLCLFQGDGNAIEQGVVLASSEYPRYFSALAAERVIDANQAQTDPRTNEFSDAYLRPLDIQSMLDATLRSEGHTQGVLCFEQQVRHRDWSDEEKIFAASIADMISQLMMLNSYRDRELRFRTLFEGTLDAVMVIRDFEI